MNPPKIEVLSALLSTARMMETTGNPEIAAAASNEAVLIQKRLADARTEAARLAAQPKPRQDAA